jgi:hypothetical protein
MSFLEIFLEKSKKRCLGNSKKILKIIRNTRLLITDDGTFENGEKTEQVLGNFVESAIEIDQNISGIADLGFQVKLG